MLQLIRKINRRRLICSAVAAAVLNFCCWAGYYIKTYHSIFDIGDKGSVRFYTWCLTALVFGLAVYGLFSLLDRVRPAPGKALSFRKVFLPCFIILLIIWFFYLRIFWPGVVTWDAYTQVEMGLGYRPLTDHHPILDTLLIGLLVRIGSMIFGTVSQGIIVYTVFQMIVLAAMLSLTIWYMVRRHINHVVCGLVFLFFALHPLIGGYSITMWKDVWIAYFILMFMLCLIELCIREESFFNGRRGMVLLIVSGLLVQFSKKTGVYIIAISLVFALIIFWKRHRKQMFLVLVITLGGYFLLHTVLMHTLNAQKGDLREALSVPLQQIARTVTYLDESSEITEEQKEAIGELLPYNKIAECYDPTLSDSIKSLFNEETFKQDMGKYFRLWLDLGLQHPKIYIDSFIENTYGYWFPDVEYWQVAGNSYIERIIQYQEEGWDIHDPDAPNYPADIDRHIKVDRFFKAYDDVRRIPGVKGFFQLAYYFWAVFLALLYFLYSHRRRMILPCIVIAAVFLTCIISPVYAEARYAFPAILGAPVIWAFLLQKRSRD